MMVVATPPTDRSNSQGSVSNGILKDGVAMPLDGPHHRFTYTVRKKGSNYGTQAMVALLNRAAGTVGQLVPGPPMVLGSISRCGGGHMMPHKSHQSGRDVDILFYVFDANGKRKAAHSFVKFDESGACISGKRCRGVRFDVQRNWWLVRTLLWSKRPQVQYIFVSNGLKNSLLAYARSRGEHPEILKRAQRVLRQPSDSSPHADHFHVRIYCSPSDREQGCQDKGPRWAWIQ